MRIVSPVRSQARPPPAALSGEALRIEGLSDVPDWRPSPIVGRIVDAALEQMVGRLHVDHLGRARPAERPGAADDQDAVLVDLERGVVDPVVIIVRAVEHDRAALEHALAPGRADR